MDVTVAIPTYDRPAVLARALATVSAPEVLVVDDGSQDPARVRRVANTFGARYVRQPHGGVNAARNTAVRLATSDLIAFIDDDVEIPEGWLDALLDGAKRHPEAGALGGPVLLRLEGELPRMCGREQLGDHQLPAEAEGPVDFLLGANFLVRREAFDAAGPFDPRLNGPNDETEWLRRVQAKGFPLVHIPEAWLWHIRTTEDLRLGYALKRSYRYGKGHVLPKRLMGEEVTFRQGVTPIPRYLAHALKARCTTGLTMAARSAGLAAGTLQRSARP